MEKRARAVGAHRELVVDDANHEELCARCHLVPLPLSEELHARIRGARLHVFARTGHVHHWEALDDFNRVTIEWLG